MKKLTAILLTAATTAVVLIGCGSSTEDSAPASAEQSAVVEETAAGNEEASSNAEETAAGNEETEANTEAASDADKTSDESTDTSQAGFQTLEEAVANTPGIQSQIDQLSESMGIEMVIEGNTMTYKFPLGMDLDESTKATIVENLEAAVEDQMDSFQSMKESLEEETGVSGITLVIIYLDNDGNEIFSKTIE